MTDPINAAFDAAFQRYIGQLRANAETSTRRMVAIASVDRSAEVRLLRAYGLSPICNRCGAQSTVHTNSYPCAVRFWG